MNGGKSAHTPFGMGRVFVFIFKLFTQSAVPLTLALGPLLFVFKYLFISQALIGYMETLDTSEPTGTGTEHFANFLIWMLSGAVLLVAMIAATVLLNILLTGSAVGMLAARGRGVKATLIAAWLAPLRWSFHICVLHLALLCVFAPLAWIAHLLASSLGAVEIIIRPLTMGLVALAIFARTAPLLPLILLDKCGWRSLRLSFSITKGYGFAIFTVLVLAGLINKLANALLSVASDTFSNTATPEQMSALLVAGSVVGESLLISFNACVLFAIYARLVEIRDGHKSQQFSSAFD